MSSPGGSFPDMDASSGTDTGELGNDALAVDSTVNDAAVDTGMPDSSRDTGPDTGTDACVPSGAENCTDGIDNDCDGKVDCEDPACTAYACVPAVPAGWVYTAVSPAPVACPGNSVSLGPVVVDPITTPATCGCSCSPSTPPSCTTGSIFAGYGGACGTSELFPSNNGACTTFTGARSPSPFILVDALPPSGGSCAAMPAFNVPPQPPPSVACRASGPLGKGCSGGQVCAPKGSSSACVAQAGQTSCPAGYGNAHALATSVSDTRGCSACTCGTPTASCTGASWDLYQQTNCSDMTPLTLTVDGNCDSVNNPSPGSAYTAYKYFAHPANVSCAGASSGSTATGSVTLGGPEKLCCH